MVGCVGHSPRIPEIYPAPHIEADWIRQGEPIEYAGELWYPVDVLENLLDSEMYLLGEYRNVQFFISKEDIRPYDRLYTKFGLHKYRVFEKSNKR